MALSQPALGRNATPAWGLQAPDPAQREPLTAARKAHTAKRHADDQGRPPLRPAPARRQSLRRVKDSREQLRTTRARGTSNATIDSTPSSSTAPGRAFTVANVNNGIIYLRYVWCEWAGEREGGWREVGARATECLKALLVLVLFTASACNMAM